jgi:dolichol-phosphate mannosyltransferase
VRKEKIKKITYIIPIYNEEENIELLYHELKPVADSLKNNYEILFVDDASADTSLTIIKALSKKSKNVKYLSFEKNCGQSAALSAGFLHASGDVIITLDGDMQNDPGDIPKLLSYYGEYDMVNGWRYNRKDTFSKKIGSKIGNGVRNFFTGDNIKDTGCSLKIMRASLLKKIKIFYGLHRFLPALMMLEGASVKEVKVNHRERKHGTSNYSNLRRAREGLYDLIAVRWMIKRQLKFNIKDKNIG